MSVLERIRSGEPTKEVNGDEESRVIYYINNGHKDKIIFKFMQNIRIIHGCWEWQGTKLSSGYGRFWYKYGRIFTHRLSFILFNGVIPDGLFILHSCDNPCCVNPKHLHVGTKQENIQEAVLRKRALIGDLNPMRKHPRFGENSFRSKLKEKEVLKIIYYLNKGISGKELAKEYHVTESAISSIKSGKSWSYLNKPPAENYRPEEV